MMSFGCRTRFECLGLICLLAVLAFGVVADDRDLLRDSSGAPYMYVVMDTSGSMHWTPVCTEEDACLDIDPWDGKCTQECTLGDEKCKRLCPDLGCVEYDFGDEPPREVEVIIDNDDPTRVQINGTWYIGGLQPWIGDDYLHNNRSGQGSKSVRFTPNLPEDGTYHVYLYWSSNNNRANNVPIDIQHKDGTATVTMDQRQGDGEWNYVGTWDFDEGTDGNVLIRTDGTTGYVAVDAIRFYSLVKPDDPPDCLRMGYRCQQDLCPRGDCFARLSADDPRSKFYQAKEALYEVLGSATDIHFGFGTYEQDNVRLKAKHWLYRVSDFKPESEGYAADTPQDVFWSGSTTPFPAVDAEYVFGNGPPYNSNGVGDGWSCASNSNYPGKTGDPDGNAGHVGCFQSEPADAENAWELERFRRIPKLGRLANQETTTWYRRNGTIFRVVYRDVFNSAGVAFEYGDPVFAVEVERTQCTSSSCDDSTKLSKKIYFELVSDYAAWEGDLARMPMRGNGFFHRQANVAASNTCNGLEPNDDRNGNVDPNLSNANDDFWWDYTFKFDTEEDPRGDLFTPRSDLFDEGDFLPLDWQKTNNRSLQERLSPNIVGGAFDPDFRTAVYWQNEYLSTSDPTSPSNRRLRLEDEYERPLLSYGSTPIAASLQDFRVWYAGRDSDSTDTGWSGIAAERDLDWACRQRYVLFLTDGNETCGGNPCQAAADLLLEGVKTYVVGFGLDDNTSNLSCIAERGGTDAPILPRNKDELVAALEEILVQVRAESRSFASASIPALQSSSADTILLSSFVPLPDVAWWPGRVDIYRKPLPLIDGRPNPKLKCSSTVQSGCHVHDVAQVMLKQVPDDLNAGTPDLGIGEGSERRRVIYGRANTDGDIPGSLHLFRPPYRGSDGNDLDLLADLGEVLVEPALMNDFDLGNLDADFIEQEIIDVMVETLKEKPLDLANDSRRRYVMGDVFHANPEVISGPNRVDYFSLNLCGDVQSGPNNCVDGVDRGYRDFALNNTWRRRQLAVAANDGQLHFFDAGTRRELPIATGGGRTEDREIFTDGTGRELFSYMPRIAMPIVREQANEGRHIFSVDGSFTVSDVFVDPEIQGGAAPNANDREWRTLIIGGMREGGSRYENEDKVEDLVGGYFALDITQPDVLTLDDGHYVPANENLATGTSDMPSCMDFNYTNDGSQRVVTAGDGNDTVIPCRYPYPAERWVFSDTAEGYFLDEENGGVGNGLPDLGDTWSQPVVGMVAVMENSVATVKHVAIFGGGLDPDNKDFPQRGTFLYMVDTETGQAIYKRELDGAVPSKPAALDLNNDAIFDVLYIGTTAGTLYKIDLAAGMPEIDKVDMRDHLTVSLGPGPPIWVDRVDEYAWEPFPLLETYDNVPIYFPPAIFSIPTLDTYGLAVGTGDRESLWDQSGGEGRLYVIVDTKYDANDVSSLGTCDKRIPITDSCLQQIAWNAAPPTVDDKGVQVDNSFDYISKPPSGKHRGWTMTFPEDFRMTNEPFMASGILFYSFFQPITFVPLGSGSEDEAVCARTGITRSFVVLARNANPVARLSGDPQVEDDDDNDGSDDTGGVSDPPVTKPDKALGSRDRYHKIGEFTTAPFIDRVSSKNQPVSSGGGSSFTDLVDAELERNVMEVIMGDYPRGSRFNEAFRLVVAALRNSTGVHVYATVPVALYPADWREDDMSGLSRDRKEADGTGDGDGDGGGSP